MAAVIYATPRGPPRRAIFHVHHVRPGVGRIVSARRPLPSWFCLRCNRNRSLSLARRCCIASSENARIELGAGLASPSRWHLPLGGSFCELIEQPECLAHVVVQL